MFLKALCKQQYACNEDYVVFKPEEKQHKLSRNHNITNEFATQFVTFILILK